MGHDQSRRHIDWALARLVLASAGMAFLLGVLVLDVWLNVVAVGDEVVAAGFAVTVLPSVQLGLLRRATPATVLGVHLCGVGIVAFYLFADVAGWVTLGWGVATLLVSLLGTNVVISTAVMNRQRARTRQPAGTSGSSESS